MDGTRRGGRPLGACSIYSEALALAFCEAVAEGASMSAVCRRAGMPSMTTVQRWVRDRPDFAGRVAAAQAAAGGPCRGGRPAIWSPALGEAVCEALVAGHALYRICAWPGFPCTTTVFRWARDIPEFAHAYWVAREIQGHLCWDEIGELRRGVTRETVGQTWVQMTGAKWQATRLAPVKYGAPEGMGMTMAPDPDRVAGDKTQKEGHTDPGGWTRMRVPREGDDDWEAYLAWQETRKAALKAGFVALSVKRLGPDASDAEKEEEARRAWALINK